MAKKIRFPLKMKDEIEVRTMDELLENFSIVSVLEHLESGKLRTWLLNCHEEEIAEQLDTLELSDADLAAKVCAIFGVEFDSSEIEDMEIIKERNRKITLLKERADDEKYIDVIDQVAFDQDDLFDLLDDGETTIYLCGNSFSIPLGKKGVTYIGIDQPMVKIASKKAVDWAEKGITLTNVCFDDAYQTILSEAKQPILEEEIDEATIRTKLEQKFIEIFEQQPREYDSEQKIKNACVSICKGRCTSDEVLYLSDTSIMANGKAGLVLTMDSIYVKDTFEDFSIRYEDIESVSYENEKFWGTWQTTFYFETKNSETYKKLFGSCYVEDELCAFIEYAISLYDNECKDDLALGSSAKSFSERMKEFFKEDADS